MIKQSTDAKIKHTIPALCIYDHCYYDFIIYSTYIIFILLRYLSSEVSNHLVNFITTFETCNTYESNT